MSSSLRIGFVGTELAPLAPDAGGLERLVTGWSTQLSTRYTTHLYSPFDDHTPTDQQSSATGAFSGTPARLQQLAEACDVLVINNRPTWTHSLTLPTLLILHNTSEAWNATVGGAQARELGPHVSVLAVSDFLAHHAREQLHLDKLPTVLPPFVDRAFTMQYPSSPRDQRLLFPNRLLVKKGVRETIAALDTRSASHLRVVFLENFAPWGSPTQEHLSLLERIRKSASCSLEPRIRYSSQLAQRMVQSAGVLAPSTRPEGLGLVPLESLALGIPTIISNLGGLAELAAYGAVTVDPFDPENFGETLAKFVAEPPDTNSGEVRAAFSIERSTSILADAIERAIRP